MSLSKTLLAKPILYLRHLIKRPGKPSVGHLLELLDRLQESNVFFMQIGANEGKTEDPIYPHVMLHKWKGIFVEPQPAEFAQLCKNYDGRSGLRFENLAISGKKEERTLFYIENSKKQLPDWVSKLSSFDRKITEEVIEVHPEAKVAEMTVPCNTVNSVLTKHKTKQLDLLYIDTEGYDFEIIKTIDFEKVKPSLIVFEHRHLSEDDFAACTSLVEKHGYRMFKDKYDGVAIKHDGILEEYKSFL